MAVMYRPDTSPALTDGGNYRRRPHRLRACRPAYLPPTIFTDPSENEGISLIFALRCSHVKREFLLYCLEYVWYIPTVCLYVTSLVASSYGYDEGKNGPTRCAVIGAARGGRLRGWWV